MTLINELRRRLARDEIARLSSPYIDGGRKQESWAFDVVEVDGYRIIAEASMKSIYVSDTDPGGFHLSLITAFEMISQLSIIALHSLAGLQTKSREVWVREGRGSFDKPLRQQQGIQLEMRISSLRQRQAMHFCEADYRIADHSGGLFKYWCKTVLA